MRRPTAGQAAAWGSGLDLWGDPPLNGGMDGGDFTLSFWEIARASFFSAFINIVYALVALLLVLATLRFVDRFVVTSVDFLDEIRKGNVAAAIFAGLTVIAIALIISFALR